MLIGSSIESIKEQIRHFDYAFTEFQEAEVIDWFAKQVPPNEVHVDDFELAVYPVTRAEYARFEASCGVVTRVKNPLNRPNHPVTDISFFEACEYCSWLEEKGLPNCRLPTENEWEYACSSGGVYSFPWGNSFQPEYANTAETNRGETTPVSKFKMNVTKHGIRDMAGNVEEWTSTPYRPYPNGRIVHDHISKETGLFYPVTRGGSYATHGDLCHRARRHGFRFNYTIVGFRVARTV